MLFLTYLSSYFPFLSFRKAFPPFKGKSLNPWLETNLHENTLGRHDLLVVRAPSMFPVSLGCAGGSVGGAVRRTLGIFTNLKHECTIGICLPISQN